MEVQARAWAPHVDHRHGFALNHPSDWNVVPGMSGLLVAIRAPGHRDFRPNMNVIRRVRDTPLGLDGLVDKALAGLARVLTEPIVIDVDTAVVADHPARRFLVAYRQGIYTLTSEQWLLLSEDHVWTVSTAAATETWDQAADTFSDMVRSFRFEVK